MARNRTFTGGKKSVGTPTLNRAAYFQLIRQIRNAKERGDKNGRIDREGQKEH